MTAFLAKPHSKPKLAKGKKKKEISPLGIVVAVACIFLFFALLFVMLQKKPVEPVPPAEKTFLEKYSDLAGAWKENGVKAERLHEALPELTGTGSAGIGKIIAALEQAKSEGDEKIALLADAYIEAAEFALAKKEHMAALIRVKKLHEKETCRTYLDYESLNKATEKMVLIAKDYSEKIKLFAEKFPEEAKALSLQAENFDWNAAEAQVARLESAVQYFKEECGK
ncbi:MAG: hypothetical protein NT067_06840 [Candidatus Diapherotrites archaeon]|nr:hypothetical protein [Candidatus Diapherotrites archaeon]